MPAYKLLVCTNERYSLQSKSCAGQGSHALLLALKERSQSLNSPIEIETIKCFGQCERGPVMRIAPAKEFYYAVEEKDLEGILKQLEELNN